MRCPGFLLFIMLAVSLAACGGPPGDEVTAGEEEWDGPLPALLRTVILPPTARGLTPSLTGDLLVIYQAANNDVASLLDLEGRVRRLPGLGSDGPATWHGDLIAYVSCDGSLEPDPSLVALFIYDTRYDTHIEARGGCLEPNLLYPPAFLDGGILALGSGGICRYSPQVGEWVLVHEMDSSSWATLAWSGDGTALAFVDAGEPAVLRVLTTATGEEHGVRLSGEVAEIAWSGDGRLAVLTRDDVHMAVSIVSDGGDGDVYMASGPVQVLSHHYTGADQLGWLPDTGLVSVRLVPAFGVFPDSVRRGDILVVDAASGDMALINLPGTSHVWLDADHVGVVDGGTSEELLIFGIGLGLKFGFR